MAKSDEYGQELERAMRLTWSSLESHLQWTHTVTPKQLERMKTNSETPRFHKKCVIEYAEVLLTLARSL